MRVDEVSDEGGFEHDAEYDTVDSITLRFSNLFGRAQYLRESGLRSLIVIAGGLLLWLIFVWVTAAAQLGQNDSSTFDHDLRKSLAHFTVPVSAVDSLISEINSEIDFVAKEIAKIVGDDLALGVRDVLERQITEKLQNLRDKAALEHSTLGSFPLSEDEILSSVVGYEIFKLKSYVTSGVFPKKLDQEKIDSSTDWKSFDLMSYPLAEQFITSSLVFNSGILFKNQTVDRIRDFDLIGYLHNVSEKSANKIGEAWRPRLPVDSSHRQAFELVVDRGYREQPTSWQAAYRILQRYGAYVAVKRFMAIVDEDDMLSLDFSPAF